jgi:MFS transporter, ACS family, hexuronate transporter
LQFSTQQYSYIVAAFQVGYTVMQSVCGFVLDFLGLRSGFTLFAVAWSISNVLHAFAGGWGSLAAFRGLLGLSEAAAIPAGIKVFQNGSPLCSVKILFSCEDFRRRARARRRRGRD